ncbi:CbtB domain-containing protein [Acuticoccus sp. MNP-M23]|uniref:CbtB domain-containing protein n=1 Tax=Acuticoccus sp. MNP-M23 TaxID=3072793 RepID=UPI00281535C1|nr:CbtB domain-containing protein [Acuticoccus sp. MNP-M23]WMS43647.1 CbtB domain-containing protein [Acuticoccus sp. MNP-M23]
MTTETMTTRATAPISGNHTARLATKDVLALAAAAFIGIATIWVTGHSQASVLHDAAHDTRHAAGFPCH